MKLSISISYKKSLGTFIIVYIGNKYQQFMIETRAGHQNEIQRNI
ncbi:hypothetical protein ABID23_000331 [Bartonella silvatica]|uniref:Uncharacterized protein n=1 Tax=Bartonella silvatica TaxID=357760 RepID=A0ABV2HFE8_9HYPH